MQRDHRLAVPFGHLRQPLAPDRLVRQLLHGGLRHALRLVELAGGQEHAIGEIVVVGIERLAFGSAAAATSALAAAWASACENVAGVRHVAHAEFAGCRQLAAQLHAARAVEEHHLAGQPRLGVGDTAQMGLREQLSRPSACWPTASAAAPRTSPPPRACPPPAPAWSGSAAPRHRRAACRPGARLPPALRRAGCPIAASAAPAGTACAARTGSWRAPGRRTAPGRSHDGCRRPARCRRAACCRSPRCRGHARPVRGTACRPGPPHRSGATAWPAPADRRATTCASAPAWWRPSAGRSSVASRRARSGVSGSAA